MLKKFLSVILILILLVAAIAGWTFFMGGTKVDGRSRFLYIHTGKNEPGAVMQTIRDSQFLKMPAAFNWLARVTGTWDKIKPGKYEIARGMSLYQLARELRNGRQTPVDLVITKLRTKEQFSALIGRKFETDSSAMFSFLAGPEPGKYGLDSNTVMTAVFPDTYTYNWTAPTETIFGKLYDQYKKVWTDDRKRLASEHGLNPTTAYILASIIEEETNIQEDKGLMASVYLNRLKKGIRLGADPTVKYALRNFELKRIYQKHLQAESPYNTYRYAGLPPGPICTPSLKTLDAVLNAPNTNYLYFVAKADFSQRHVFTETYPEHLKYAREYQEALNKLQQEKQNAKEDTGN